MSKVLVVGSYNVGLTVLGPRIPVVGETVLGSHFDMGPGGKGSNQAIAIARLGGDVAFLAKVGDDIFGRAAMELFDREGIDTSYVSVDGSAHTGAGIIFVDEDGHNAIGVAPGANSLLTAEELVRRRHLFEQCDILLVQFEIPLPTVYQAVRMAKDAGATVIVNPAPAQRIDEECLPLIDVLTPNETETQILTGMEITDRRSAIEAGRRLLGWGVKSVILTLGKDGAVLLSDGSVEAFDSYEVQAVDTTGAGDAFNGGLAWALAAGRDMAEAIRLGSKVAALSVTQVGVVPGLPTMEQVRAHFGDA